MSSAFALLVLTLSGLGLGAWSLAAPLDFYGTFPGFGHSWMPELGPYNEYLVRDMGALNLALGLLALIAMVRPDRVTPAAAGAVSLAYALPHGLFHVSRLALFPPIDQLLQAAALLSLIAASATLLIEGSKPRR